MTPEQEKRIGKMPPEIRYILGSGNDRFIRKEYLKIQV